LYLSVGVTDVSGLQEVHFFNEQQLLGFGVLGINDTWTIAVPLVPDSGAMHIVSRAVDVHGNVAFSALPYISARRCRATDRGGSLEPSSILTTACTWKRKLASVIRCMLFTWPPAGGIELDLLETLAAFRADLPDPSGLALNELEAWNSYCQDFTRGFASQVKPQGGSAGGLPATPDGAPPSYEDGPDGEAYASLVDLAGLRQQRGQLPV
jgi:hypothetical protein